jgi:phage terminase large subunit GpA-like protein
VLELVNNSIVAFRLGGRGMLNAILRGRVAQYRRAIEAEARKDVEAETEQTFWNDVLGLPFEQASKGPDWEKLRDRAENAPEAETLPQWVLPSTGFILAAGADCQADRIEVQIVAFCRNMRRLVVGYIIIPHYIGDKEGREALDALLKQSWRTERGLRFPLDVLAIDGSTFTEDVRAFVKRHPSHRVFIVKGASSANGPILMPMRRRRADGKVLGDDRQAFIVNVSQMKADFYAWLTKEDPLERGFVGFARALGDEYYRQVTAEVRVLKRAPSGVMVSSWQLAETGRRNEALDTMNYAEAGARRKAWLSMTDLQWEKLADDRGGAPAESQGDLFDSSVPVMAPVVSDEVKQKTEEAKRPAKAKRDSDWIEPRADWI